MAENSTTILDETLAPVAEFAHERREVRFSRSNLPLTIHRPKDTSRGTIVLIPGWSGPRSGAADILVFIAEKLSGAGWSAIRMDLPGRGDSEGEFADVDLDDMIEAACDVAAEQDSAQPIIYLGMCSGGNVSLGAVSANEIRKANTAVIALSTLPFQPARTQSLENRRRWKNLKQYAAKALSPNTWARLIKGEINMDRVKKNVSGGEKPTSGERNLKDSARDIEKELRDWKGGALFIWGGGDEEAGLSRAHFEKLHQAGLGARDNTFFETIPGANHNFYSRAWREELSRKILEFLNKK